MWSLRPRASGDAPVPLKLCIVLIWKTLVAPGEADDIFRPRPHLLGFILHMTASRAVHTNLWGNLAEDGTVCMHARHVRRKTRPVTKITLTPANDIKTFDLRISEHQFKSSF